MVEQRQGQASTAPRHGGRRIGTPHLRVAVFSACLAIAAAVLYVLLELEGHPAPLGANLPWWALVAVLVAGERLVVEFPVRRQTWTISMDEVAFTLGIAMATPAHLLSAAVVAAAIVNLGLHRRPLQKVVYNLSATALRAVASAAIYHALLGSTSPLEPAGWLAAFLAVLIPSLVTFLTLSIVVALAEAQRPHWSPWAPVTTLVISVSNTSFALVTLAVWHADARGMWLLALVYGLLYVAYRTLVSARRQQQGLAHVDAFSRAVTGAAGVPDVAGKLLDTADDMIGADIVRLVLFGPDEEVVCWERADDDYSSAPLDDVAVVAAFDHVATGSSRLVFSSLTRWWAGTPRDGGLLLPNGVRDGIVVGFSAEHDIRGVVVVAGHRGAYRSFVRREALLLETLASHAASSFAKLSLAERVHREIIQREHDALHDRLTGLPNRLLFLDRLERAAAAASDGLMAAVLLVDLDRFHDVNATFGHRTGDELLARVGTRLRDEVPATSTVARLGGDEFGVLLCELTDSDQAHQAAARLLTVLERPHEVQSVPLNVEASVGIAFAPADGAGAVELLRRADVAMYAAKNNPSGIRVYEPPIDRHSPERLRLVSELREAIDTGGLSVHYQPKADLHTGDVRSVEALARWEHPERGFIPPSEFIVVAEHTSLIRPLTRWMLREVAGQLARWRQDGLQLEGAVNLSARSMFDTDLPGDIAALLGEFSLPPDALRLEITESSLIVDPELAAAILHDLSVLGVGLSVDDFGTGYSSLSHLIGLPVDEIKIDRSFVSELVGHGQRLAIVRATIDMGRRLGKQLTAEGIEDQPTWDLLRELGCDLAQGYFLSRPLPPVEFERWLRERRGARSRYRAAS